MEVTTIIGDIRAIGSPSSTTGRKPDGSSYSYESIRFQVQETAKGSTRTVTAGGGLAQAIHKHLKNGQAIACTILYPDASARYGTPIGRVVAIRALSGVSEEAFNEESSRWESFLFTNADGAESETLRKQLAETLELLKKQQELNQALSSRNNELETLLSIVNDVAPR